MITVIKRFSLDDQRAFTALSGDSNPIHVDPVAARRVFSGRLVVHGLHLLLSGLDAVARVSGGRREMSRLVASFDSPVGLDEDVTLTLTCPDETSAAVVVETRRGRAGQFDVGFRQPLWAEMAQPLPHASGLWEREARALGAADMDAREGDLPLAVDIKSLDALFPDLPRVANRLQVAEILATTYLVGMECPGRHSIFSGLTLDFDADEPAAIGAGMHYRVSKFDARFSMAAIDVSGPGVRGNVRAFLRPAPVVQPSVSDLRGLVNDGEFRAQRALVVGGSRGLGEVAAKLLGAGGAAVTITYHLGADDATRLVDELTRAGLRAETMQWDVLNPPSLASMPRPTHVYYFATPRIVTGPGVGFSYPLFAEYADVYLRGLLNTLTAAAGPSLEGLAGVYCPSSVFVDEIPRGFGEYAAAKSAAETLCAVIGKGHPHVRVRAPRLPRLRTDQTAGVMARGFQDSGALLLAHLRDLSSPAA